jgi:hypothetical protein
MCDTNKNVIKMSVIIKGVYCVCLQIKPIANDLQITSILSSKRWIYLNIYVIGVGKMCKRYIRCWVAFVVENNKVNIAKNWIAKPTFLPWNECHFHSISPNELILVGNDR